MDLDNHKLDQMPVNESKMQESQSEITTSSVMLQGNETNSKADDQTTSSTLQIATSTIEGAQSKRAQSEGAPVLSPVPEGEIISEGEIGQGGKVEIEKEDGGKDSEGGNRRETDKDLIQGMSSESKPLPLSIEPTMTISGAVVESCGEKGVLNESIGALMAEEDHTGNEEEETTPIAQIDSSS